MQVELFQTVEYTLPAHWLPAIINDDYSGIDDDNEIEIIESILDDIGSGIISIPDDTEEYFTRYHDASDWGFPACNVMDVTVTYLP